MKTISIGGHEVEVSTPYAEGATINAIEAKVLNQTRAENIANNFRKRLKDAADNAEALAETFAAIRSYDAEYAFTAVTRGTSTALSPVERMALSLAKKWLSMKLKETDFKTLKAYTEAKGEEYVDAKLSEIAETDDIQKEAAAAVKRAQKAVSAPLGIAV